MSSTLAVGVTQVSHSARIIGAEVIVANREVKIDDPDALQDPAEEGVANEDGPDGDELTPDDDDGAPSEEESEEDQELAIA
jgi:hypothetical protein